MKIKLLTVGKIQNPSFSELARDYMERLKHYVDFSWVIVKPETGKNITPVEIIVRESARLMQKSLSDYIALDKNGKELNSEEFSSFISRKELEAKPLVFVIGGPWGLSRELVEKSYLCLSLSKMTFPHEMAAVILLEQLYRAYTILRNEGYHKKNLTTAASDAYSLNTPPFSKKSLL